MALVLLTATFVAYPSQSAYAHDNSWHWFCYEQTLLAVDFAVDFFIILGPLAKILAGLIAFAAGVVLSLACDPEIIPPKGIQNSVLPCNVWFDKKITTFRNFSDKTPKGEKKNAVPMGITFSDQNFDYYYHPNDQKYWKFGDDDLTEFNGPPHSIYDNDELDALFFPVIGSYRDSVYLDAVDPNNQTKIIKQRAGFGVIYETESALVWFAMQGPAILELILSSLGLHFLPKYMKEKIIEVVVGAIALALDFLFASTLDAKNQIAQVDSNAGLITHTSIRAFDVVPQRTNRTEAVIEGALVDSTVPYYPLGPNEIKYFGFTEIAGKPSDDYPAKYYFNVEDVFLPVLSFNGSKTKEVEANAPFGFKVTAESKKLLGMDDFIYTDECDPEPELVYAGFEVIPLAKLAGGPQEVPWKVIEHKSGYTVWETDPDNFSEQSILTNTGANPFDLVTNGESDICLTKNLETGECDEVMDYEEFMSVNHDLALDFKNATLGTDIQFSLQDSFGLVNKVLESYFDKPGVFPEFCGRQVGVLAETNLKLYDRRNSTHPETTDENFIANDEEHYLAFNEEKPLWPDIFAGCLVETGGNYATKKLADKFTDKLASAKALKNGKTFLVKNAAVDELIEAHENLHFGKGIDIEIFNNGKKHGLAEVDILDEKALKKQKKILQDQIDDIVTENVKWKSAVIDLDIKGGAVGFGGKALSVAAAAITTALDEDTTNPEGDAPKIQEVPSSFTKKYQTITVVDNTPPSILVTGLAAQAVDCDEIDCDNDKVPVEKIKVPLVSDIADPSPVMFSNFTADGICFVPADSGIDGFNSKLKPKCDIFYSGNFTIGVTNIGWIARDFSNNDSTIVTQIVNVKDPRDNEVSVPLNSIVNATQESPKIISLVAENLDNDPVAYRLENNPDAGILRSPLEPVFQDRVKTIGKTSKLNGLTVLPWCLSDPCETKIFYPDTQNSRIMKKLLNETSSVAFLLPDYGVNQTMKPSSINHIFHYVVDTPTLVEITTRFVIGDWENEKISIVEQLSETTNSTFGTSQTLATYDISGLLESPEHFETKGDLSPNIEDSTFEVIITDSARDSLITLKPNMLNQISYTSLEDAISQGAASELRIGGGLVEPQSITYGDWIWLLDEKRNEIVHIKDKTGENAIDVYSIPTVDNVQPNNIEFRKTMDGPCSPLPCLLVTNSSSNGLLEFNVANQSGNEHLERILGVSTTALDVEKPDGLSTVLEGGQEFVYIFDSKKGSEKIVKARLDVNPAYLEKNIDVSNLALNPLDIAIHPLDPNIILISDNQTNNHKLLAIRADKGIIDTTAIPNITNVATKITQMGDQFIYASNSSGSINLLNSKSVVVPYLNFGSFGQGDSQFTDPQNVAVDQAGNIYVADDDIDSIKKFDPDGNFLLKFGITGNDEGEFNRVHDITFGPNGNMYVTDSNNDRVQIFDSEGNFVSMFGWGVDDGTNEFQICTEFCRDGFSGSGVGQFSFPTAIESDTFGNIYVLEDNSDRIQKFGSQGNFILMFGVGVKSGNSNFEVCTSDCLPGSDVTIRGMALDGLGNIYLVDYSDSRIFKWDAGFEEQLVFGSSCNFTTGQGCIDPDGSGPLEFGDGQFFSISGIAVSSTGEIYVSDEAHDRLQIFDSAGNFVKKLNTSGANDGQFDGPTGITIDRNEDIYVVEQNNHRIQKFGFDKPQVLNANKTIDSFAFNSIPFGITNILVDPFEGNLTTPMGMAFAPNGDLYVSSFYSNEIKQFDGLTGQFIDNFVSEQNLLGAGNLTRPHGMVYGSNSSSFFVSSYDSDCVKEFAFPGGEFLGDLICRNDNALQNPTGIELSMDEKTLYVADPFHNSIIEYDFDSDKTKFLVDPSNTDSVGVDDPVALEMSNDGFLYVANSNGNSITKHNSTINEVFLDELQVQNPVGLYIDDDKQLLYVTENLPGLIDKVKVFDFNDKTLLHQFDFEGPTAIIPKHDSENLLVGGSLRNEIIEIGQRPDIYIANWEDQKIYGYSDKVKIDSATIDLSQMFSATGLDTFNLPSDVVSLGGDEIIIADNGNNRILKFNNTEPITQTNNIGGEPFLQLEGIAYDGNNIFALESTRIRVLDKELTQVIREIPLSVIDNPKRIAANNLGVFVTDENTNTVKIFEPNIAFGIRTGFETLGLHDHGKIYQMNSPTAITLDDQHAYVADTNRHRIAKLNFEPSYYDDNYSNSTGNWVKFGAQQDSMVMNSSKLVFDEIQNGILQDFTGAYTQLPLSLPDSWVTNFDLNLGSKSNSTSQGFVWFLTDTPAINPRSDTPLNGIGLLLKSSKLFIFEKNGTDITEIDSGLQMTEGQNLIQFQRQSPEQGKLQVVQVFPATCADPIDDPYCIDNCDPDDPIFGDLCRPQEFISFNPPPILFNVTSSISSLQYLQHSNDVEGQAGVLDITIDKQEDPPCETCEFFVRDLISPQRYGWTGWCSGGTNCIVPDNDPFKGASNGFLCTDDTCDTTGVRSFINNGHFKNPQGISSDDDKIIIADSGNGRVQILDKNGNFISRFSNEIFAPSSVSIDTQEDAIFLTEPDQNLVTRFNSTDGTKISELKEFEMPQSNFRDIDFDSEGNILMTDSFTTLGNSFGRILKIDPVEKTKLQEFPLESIPLSTIECFPINPSNPSRCVQNDGTLVENYENKTISITEPFGLSIDKSNDDMYVSDWNNQRIAQFSEDGDFIAIHKFNNTFNSPSDFAQVSPTFDPDNLEFFVVEGADMIKKTDKIRMLKEFSTDHKIEGITFEGREQFPTNVYFSTNSTNTFQKILSMSSIELLQLINGKVTDGVTLPLTPQQNWSIKPVGISQKSSELVPHISDWKNSRLLEFNQNGDLIGTLAISKELSQNLDFLGDFEFYSSSLFGQDDALLIADARLVRFQNLNAATGALIVPYYQVDESFLFLKGLEINDDNEFYIFNEETNTLGAYTREGFLIDNITPHQFPISSNVIDIALVPKSATGDSDTIYALEKESFVSIFGQDTKFRIIFNDGNKFVENPFPFVNTIYYKFGTVFDVDRNKNLYVTNTNDNEIMTWHLPTVIDEEFCTDLSLYCNLFVNNFANPDPIQIHFVPPNPSSRIIDIDVDVNGDLFILKENNIAYFLDISSQEMSWMGKCKKGTDKNADCDSNDSVSRGLTCKTTNDETTEYFTDPDPIFGSFWVGKHTVYTYSHDEKSCIFEDSGGDGEGQFQNIRNAAISKIGDLFISDFPDNSTGPRVQKFSDKGFFIENFISDATTPELEKLDGNFNEVKDMEMGKDFFYVVDPERLHFFDTRPFSPVLLDKINNQSISNVTYVSNPNVFSDTFEFSVTDGFNASKNGIVTLNIANNDDDDDGIFDDIDLSISSSLSFSDSENGGETFGKITNTSDPNPILLVRDEVYPEGIFIQNDVESTNSADFEICGEMSISVKPRDRVMVKCNPTTIEVIRGSDIPVTFTDEVGRTSEMKISYPDKITFDSTTYSFESLNQRSPAIDVHVSFNGENYSYDVKSNGEDQRLTPASTLTVDTSPPAVSCVKTPLLVESDIEDGVSLSRSNQITIEKLRNFIFSSQNPEDVDNGNPTRIITKDVSWKWSERDTFSLDYNTLSFTATDDIGNEGSCSQIIDVVDTTRPKVFLDTLELTVETLPHDDVASIYYQEPVLKNSFLLDRPNLFYNLTTWKFESYPASNAALDPPDWVIENNGTLARQVSNSLPNVFYGDIDAKNPVRVSVQHEEADDDFLGFVLGFNSDDTTNFNANYLLIDWKDNTQPDADWGDPYICPKGGAPMGLHVSKVIGIPSADELWQHDNLPCSGASNGVTDYGISAATLSNTGYGSSEHTFDISLNNTNLSIIVDGIEEFNIEDDFSDINGKFGFYTFGQENTVFDTKQVFDKLEENQKIIQPKCIQTQGFKAPVGKALIACTAVDLNSNVASAGVKVTINENPKGVTIDSASISKYHQSTNSTSESSLLTVRFSHDTNEPPVRTPEDIDKLLKLNQGDLGINYTGYFVNPSTLHVILNNTESVILGGITEVNLKDSATISSASGVLNHTSQLVTIIGSKNFPLAPFITSFIANDPTGRTSGTSTLGVAGYTYGVGDELSIIFSEPTNRAGFDNSLLQKSQVDSIFEFSHPPGEDYSGIWLDDQTFRITIKEVNQNSAQNPQIGKTTVMVKQTANLKNIAETSHPSISKSWELYGSFEPFRTPKKVLPNFRATTSTPSGMISSIQLPTGSELIVIEAAENSLNLTSNTLDVSKIFGTVLSYESVEENPCILGCPFSFTFSSEEMKRFGVASTDDLVLVHDKNNDLEITDDEIIPANIENVTSNVFTAKKKVFSLSSIGMGIIKPIEPDNTPPVFERIKISDGPGGFEDMISDDIQSQNNIGLASVTTKKTLTITVDMGDNSGPDAIEHISLYMNIREPSNQIQDSDTYIQFDTGFSNIVSVTDENNLLSSTSLNIFNVGNVTQAVFEIEFDKTMLVSDIILRMWDQSSNVRDAQFAGLIEVAGFGTGLPPVCNLTNITEDWIIDSTCSLGSNFTPPSNIVVQNNSVLIIEPGVTLDVDFENQNLTVKSGSGVLIKQGAKID